MKKSELRDIAKILGSIGRTEVARILAKLSPIPSEIMFQECIWYSTVASPWNIIGQ